PCSLHAFTGARLVISVSARSGGFSRPSSTSRRSALVRAASQVVIRSTPHCQSSRQPQACLERQPAQTRAAPSPARVGAGGGGLSAKGSRTARWRNRDERTKQAMTLVEGARGEEESIRRAIGVVGRSLTEGQRPEAIDRERWSVGGVQGAAGLELALTGEGCRVEGVDASVAEIADE